MMGPWGWGMGVGSILFVALIVIGVLLVVRPPSRGEGGRDDDADDLPCRDPEGESWPGRRSRTWPR
jgi:hypothetical protein